MKTTRSKSKKLLVLSLVLVVTLLAIGFTMSAFAEDNSDAVWTFSADSVKDPLYIQEYFTELPRAFEAEVNFASGSYSAGSPIIANWMNNDSRDAFGFQISKDGSPSIYYYSNTYDAANSKTVTTKSMASFSDYNVYGKGWVRLSVVNEIVDGKPIYKLYVNGELKQTITSFTTVHDIDPIGSQEMTRELSIGNDGKHYFKGELRNVAVYKTLTAEEAAKTAKENMQSGNVNLMAYYDATMSGNADKFIKDQTGNGHDAYSAYFERTEPLKDYAYSFAFIGDTQFLVEKDVNENTTKYSTPIFDWIIANKDKKNIQHVFGLGDITDNNADAEWEYAVTLYEKFGNAGVDYSIIPGNHDDYTTPAKKYNNYFGNVSSFVDSIDGYYIDGRLENFYTKFDVGAHQYMVIGLQYGAPDDVLAWANEVVAANPERQVIVITHSLFDNEGNWSQKDTPYQTTTSVKTLNNGIDFWNKFISLHENIVLAVSGHITDNIYSPKTFTGVNGNVVNTLLIDPQGVDMATGYDTGLVAMFYFSEDGSDVHVECVSTTKTLRAQAADPTSDDILFHVKNQYDFTIGFEQGDYKVTAYGKLPLSCYDAGNNFAIFADGAFLGGYKTWNEATQAVADIFTADNMKDVAILLLNDYTNTSDALVTLAANYANGTLTIDLGKNTFTRSDTFLNLSSSSDLSNVAPSNIIVKNGTVRSDNGKPIIDNQITDKDYPAEKVWNITFEDVTVGYGANVTSYKGLLYQAWTNDATNDDAQLGTKVNLAFNDCTFDLKTNVPTEAVTLFALKDDHSGIDKVDVALKIKGGKILANQADLANLTFYTLNDGSDTITLAPDSKGAYTKLITDSTPVDTKHYAQSFPTADGNRYFVEISDDGTESVYELQSLTVKGENVSITISLGTNNANAKYLSAIDYPFVVGNQKGTFSGAFAYLLGNNGGSSATGNAIHSVVLKKNSDGKYQTTGNSAYILMRADYTMKDYGSADEKNDNLSQNRGSVTLDMCGHTIYTDANFTSESIFDSTIKAWTGTNDGVQYFPSSFTVKNGAFKTYKTYVIRFKANNSSADIANKLMSWTFENVEFGLVKGATVAGFFHVKNASNTGSSYPMAPLNLTITDCTFDIKTNTSSADPFYVFKTNFADTGRIKATVKVNGCTVLANSFDKVTLSNFIYKNGATFTIAPGSDGKYLSILMPKTASTSKLDGLTFQSEKGTELTFAKVNDATTATYSFCIETKYGYVSGEYEDVQKYPFFVFKKDGTFVGAYADWAIDAKASALHASKAEGSVVLLRRDYTYSASQYNNLSQTYSVTIDLNGFELKTTNATLFMAQKKTEWETKVTVINGDIVVAGQRSVVRMDTGASFSGKYGFIFEFTNVNFKLPEGTQKTNNLICWSSFAEGDPAQYCNFTFNNCVFDLSNATQAFNIFDVSEKRSNVKVVVNGGEIITSDYAVTVWKTYDATIGSASPESSLTFAKNESGNYTTLVVPTGVALPITTVNGGELTFVKTADDGKNATYSLVAVNLSVFSPKTSVTLSTELVYNVYVPVIAGLKSFTIDGETYLDAEIVTLEDGAQYYHVAIALPSTEAARNIVLKATLSVDGKDYSGSFTMSIPKYAKKVIETSTSDVEKTLVKDVLAYVQAAYNYFVDYNTADEIARVNAIVDELLALGGDYFGEPTISGTTAKDNGGIVTGVTLNLDYKPTIRFYVTDTNVEFKIGNTVLNTVKDVEGKYVELDVYAYALAETITFGDGGSYHISDFLEKSAGADHENLVACFVKYVESAAAYRNSVVNK